jgi:hypothetical protein
MESNTASAQLYMFFYYLGPSLLLLTLLPCCRRDKNVNDDDTFDDPNESSKRPSWRIIAKASLTACFDISAQSLNYTGASLAGATIFAVVYSSVTVWTAVFSRIFLKRSVTITQGCAVVIVFAGLCVTTLDSIKVGNKVALGTALVLFGSCMHGATYVMSESLMKRSTESIFVENCCKVTGQDQWNEKTQTRETLLVHENSAIQGVVACSGLAFWQIVYTFKRWDELIQQPMDRAGTTYAQALIILSAFGLANLVHSLSFYHTLANYPGGSTSAGLMKGLQAVLVFIAAHFLYCHGGAINEQQQGMCFSIPKFISLITVVGGVVLYSAASPDRRREKDGYASVQEDNLNDTEKVSRKTLAV